MDKENRRVSLWSLGYRLLVLGLLTTLAVNTWPDKGRRGASDVSPSASPLADRSGVPVRVEVINPVLVAGPVEVSNAVRVDGWVKVAGSVDIEGPVAVYGADGIAGRKPVRVEVER